MTPIYREADIDPGALLGQTIAVVGYGNQGHAHALNLRDQGANVIVGQRKSGPRYERAVEDGFDVYRIGEAVAAADVVMLTLPDVAMADVFREEVAGALREGALLLAHGFAIHFGLIDPPATVDIGLAAPKGPGAKLRERFLEDSGLAGVMAVHRDVTGTAHARTLAYARGIGCARIGVFETSFREETETDLFSEQTVLCGGIPELIKAAFETLVEAGYSPEAAYFECLHEAKLITDLIFERGLAGMRSAISDTAAWGGLSAGPRVIGDATREAMRQTLADIQSGTFARDWIGESASGRPRLRALQELEAAHPVEEVRRSLIERMPGLEG